MSIEILLLLVGAGAAIAYLCLEPVASRRRRGRLVAREVPPAWPALLRRRWRLYRRLPPDVRERLHACMQVFLAEKRFFGCAGVEITEAMRVTIAAQACLLVAGRNVPCYPHLRSILVYPDAFTVPVTAVDEAGVRSDELHDRSGESWDTGRVILSWADVLHGALHPGAGANVALHEFAHQVDLEFGGMDGAPDLATGERRERWARVFNQEFEALRARAERAVTTTIDPYGAESPAEFFAVATEAFFDDAPQLAREHPALYAELAEFYQLDPRAWT
jgi:hypothetical protein